MLYFCICNEGCVGGARFRSQVGHVRRKLMLPAKRGGRAFDLQANDKNCLQVTTCKQGPSLFQYSLLN